jgi:hypothetical protein
VQGTAPLALSMEMAMDQSARFRIAPIGSTTAVNHATRPVPVVFFQLLTRVGKLRAAGLLHVDGSSVVIDTGSFTLMFPASSMTCMFMFPIAR